MIPFAPNRVGMDPVNAALAGNATFGGGIRYFQTFVDHSSGGCSLEVHAGWTAQ